MLGATKRSVELWVKAYRDSGLSGLKPRPHPGGKPRITQEQRRIISETALKSPRTFGYSRTSGA
jgi:transposase